MFTGLIKQVGKLAAREMADDSLRLVINTPPWNPPLAAGESIAVNGVCLTVVRTTDREFACDVLKETGRCSNLNAKHTGAALNLERALKLGESLGGHLTTGHVEGTGTLVRRITNGRDGSLDLACDLSLLRQIIPKGSIACDGVSLTVAFLTDAVFSVNIIPFTWANTNLHLLREGDTVNLETDLVGKHVFRWLEQNQKSSPFAKATGDREIIPLRQGYRGQGDHPPSPRLRGTGRSGEKPAGSITENILRDAGFLE